MIFHYKSFRIKERSRKIKNRKKSMKWIGNMSVLEGKDFEESKENKKKRELESVKMIAMNGDIMPPMAGQRIPFYPVAR